jgi:DNA-binding HxlR family transcriptional regulator
MEPSRRPVMQLLDLLGRRWTLRVMWELHERAPRSFGQLRDASERMSTSVLSTRLRELQEAGLVVKADGDYALSDHGSELVRLLLPLNGWADAWAGRQRSAAPHRGGRSRSS